MFVNYFMFCEIYISLKYKSYRFHISIRIFYLEHSYKMIIMRIDQNIEYSDRTSLLSLLAL